MQLTTNETTVQHPTQTNFIKDKTRCKSLLSPKDFFIHVIQDNFTDCLMVGRKQRCVRGGIDFLNCELAKVQLPMLFLKTKTESMALHSDDSNLPEVYIAL